MSAFPQIPPISRSERIAEKLILCCCGFLFWPFLAYRFYQPLTRIQSMPHCLQIIFAVLASALMVWLAAMAMIENLPGHREKKKAIEKFNACLKTFQFPLKSLFFFPQLYPTSIEDDVVGIDIELDGQQKTIFVGVVDITQVIGENYLVQFPDATWSSGRIVAHHKAIITAPSRIDFAPHLVPGPLTKHPSQLNFV